MTIKFNQKIYGFKAVKSAADAYKDLANFEIKKKGKYIEVCLKNAGKNNLEILEDEFSNYVLFINSKSV